MDSPRSAREPGTLEICVLSSARFPIAAKHFNQQKIATALATVEEAGVDIVFAAMCTITSDRSRFDSREECALRTGAGGPRQFRLDEQFDGMQRTKPDGVI